MNLGIKLALLTALLIGIAIVGPGFCVTPSTVKGIPVARPNSRVVDHYIIKVHTEHGVITLPGRVDSWDEAENAIFIADSIADLQIATGGGPFRISNEWSASPSFISLACVAVNC